MRRDSELGRAVASAVAKHFSVPEAGVRFESISEKPDIADASRVSLVLCEARPIAVVLEGSAEGDLAFRAADRARAATAILGERLRPAVLVPTETGKCGDRTFVLYAHCQTVAKRGVRRLFSEMFLAPEVLGWLRDVARETRAAPSSEEVERLFLQPLAALARLSAASDLTRNLAQRAHDELERGTWQPLFTLMHGDLWMGNVLIAPRLTNGRADLRWWKRFVISDWPGGKVKGFPIYDLVRFARSARIPQRSLRRELARHCAALGCDPRHASLHLLAALADLNANLEQFPTPRFAEVSDECITTLQGALGPGAAQRVPRS